MDRSNTPRPAVLELYEHPVRSQDDVLTFYLDFPTEVSPLTRRCPEPRLAQKWDLVGWGAELGPLTELIDPLDPARSDGAQSLLADRWIRRPRKSMRTSCGALYAMPPAGGPRHGVRTRHHDADRTEHPRHDVVPAGQA